MLFNIKYFRCNFTLFVICCQYFLAINRYFLLTSNQYIYIIITLMNAKIKKTLMYTGLTSLFFFLGLSLFLKIESFPGHENLRVLLIERLAKNESFAGISQTPDNNNVIYVLGGWQGSLESRFRVAAELYHKGAAKKILFLSISGITEYDTQLGRNLTNDEWAVKMLLHLGVKREDIEPVLLEKGFFGTFAEAKGVANLAAGRDYKHLILITSSYHALRTRMTFSSFLNKDGITLYMYTIDESIGLYPALLENFKFILYREVLLPIYN